MNTQKILETLDAYLHKNDYVSAEKHLIYWRDTSRAEGNFRIEFLTQNELMGLYRKLGRREEALACVDRAIELTEEIDDINSVSAATVYLNIGTVYKAFSMPEHSLVFFEEAKEIYEKKLWRNDERLAGLYNNMGLTLVDLGRFDEAKELYRKAVKIAKGTLDEAITYLNMASAAEAEQGLLESETEVNECLDIAKNILENHPERDGYYAFVCEKCASVFGYYGRFLYEKELRERAETIYGEGT